jgi:fused signal recognition particle receptor
MFGFKSASKNEVEAPTGLFASLRQRLTKTRENLSNGLADLLLGKKQIDDEMLEQLEDQLLMADVGIQATQKITSRLAESLQRKQLGDSDSLLGALKSTMIEILAPCAIPLSIDTGKKPFVILMVGVNGAGKTTTVGKLAQQFKNQGLKVMLAAGDTFRAAAVEQLQAWGDRLEVPVIKQGKGADSASVIFDALKSAQARGIDVLIADTAGRLHTQSSLMDELEKIKRVMSKLDPDAPQETLLVLDSGTGQNALAQASNFRDTIGISGIILTKLDGTAKGGMIFSVAEHLQTPIRYIGVGESVDDLRPFDRARFRDMIEFHNVTKRFEGGYEALSNVSLKLDEGQMAFITGHSGAGKSTLLKIIALIEKPTRGQALLNRVNLNTMSRRRIPYIRRNIGIIFQDHQLLFDRSVFDNVALPLHIQGYRPQEIAKRTRAALDKVGLLHKEKSLPITLSGGEQQRVGIARAVVHKPMLLLADEPTGNLDPELSREIMQIFVDFNQVGVTVLVASHDLDLIDELDKPRITLNRGKLILNDLEDAPQEADGGWQ